MRKKLFSVLLGLVLWTLPAAALNSIGLCEIEGPFGAFKHEQSIQFDGKEFSATLNRPTGWKIASVYQVESLEYTRYFQMQTDLDWALENGKVVRETGWTESVESVKTLTCPYKAPYVVVCYEPCQYTVVFNANASSANGTMAAQTGLCYTNTTTTLRSNAFVRTGYVFVGWTTAASGTGTVFPDGAAVGGAKFGVTTDGQTVTLYAKWLAKSYNVTYDEAGGAAGSSRPSEATYDVPFKVSAPTWTGHTFQGWTVSGYDANMARYGTDESSVNMALSADGQITASGDVWLKNLTPTANATVTLSAQWKVITCQVTFIAEGGRGGTESRAIDYGQASSGYATISPPERDNYVFQGYYTKQEGMGTCYFDAEGHLLKTWDITETACTLYAHWKEATYIVTFNLNGGRGAVDDLNVRYSEWFALPSDSGFTPPSDGQTFGGWALSEKASAATYSAGAQTRLSENSQHLSGGRLTFYAYWKDDTRTVAVDAMGGQASSNDFSVVIGRRYDARGPLPTAMWSNGKKLFTGWYTAANGGQWVQASDTVPEAVPSRLYAHWTNAAYTVRFDGNGSREGMMADQTIFFGIATPLSSNSFARTGYTFAGWAQTNAPTRVVFADGSSVTDLATHGGEVLSLLAVWTTNTYYVSFDANGGEGTMSTLTNLYDRAFALPANQFARSGFWGFSAWRDMATGRIYSGGDEVLNLTNMPFATVTMQAVWTNSLSELSQAMHCDNLDWHSDEPGGIAWTVFTGSDVGHGTDSCVRQANGRDTQWLCAELAEPGRGVQGTLSFWWKPTGAATSLEWILNPETSSQVRNVVSAEKDIWTNVVVRIKETVSKVALVNATVSGEGYCYIDGMTWTPDGANPTPGASDRVVVSSMTQTAGGLSLTFTGDARFAYHLRATDSLSPTNWYDFGPTNAGADAEQSFVIPFDAAVSQRFFMIQTIKKPMP